MPTLALHFAIDFLGDDVSPRIRKSLKFAYALTLAFLLLLWIHPEFISGVYTYSWGYYPKAGWIHAWHTLAVMTTAIYGTNLFRIGLKKIEAREGRTKRFHETRYLLLAFIFITCAGSDFLHNWGVDFFPIGCFFASLFIVSTTYAIFRHNLMGVTFVIQKGLIYSSLLSIVASFYFITVYLIGTFLGDISNTHSAPFVLVILAILTLAFKPLEQKIEKAVERLFYKSREQIENENTALLKTIQQQDKMKAVATLAAGMAHEIKNPLTAIKTFTDNLNKKSNDPEFICRFQKIVSSEINKIDGIVKQLLEFSKPSPLKIETVSINQILDETLDLLNADFLKHGIRVKKQFQSKTIVRGDKKQLKQVFLNLFLNSIDAMPSGGSVTVLVSALLTFPPKSVPLEA